MGNSKLMLFFPRLFSLRTNKDIKVGESRFWVNETWNWSFTWRRVLFSREQEVANHLLSIVKCFSLQETLDDRRLWKHSPDGIYSIKGAY